MTPDTLTSCLASLYRAQPATYRAALEASPSGWRLREPYDGDTQQALAMLRMVAEFGGYTIDSRYLFERQRDGLDFWRERCAVAGVPVPNRYLILQLQKLQLATDCDAVGEYIRIYRTI